jgi:capsule biosynthesis phosphatase
MNSADDELSQRRRAARARADRTLCVDVDDTLCFTDDHDYTQSRPNDPVVVKVREAKAKGWWIILHTARGMGRSGGHIETVADEVLDEVRALCERHDIPYDEIVVGKPWARWYIDDRALRPDEFTELEL